MPLPRHVTVRYHAAAETSPDKCIISCRTPEKAGPEGAWSRAIISSYTSQNGSIFLAQCPPPSRMLVSFLSDVSSSSLLSLTCCNEGEDGGRLKIYHSNVRSAPRQSSPSSVQQTPQGKGLINILIAPAEPRVQRAREEMSATLTAPRAAYFYWLSQLPHIQI